MAQPPNAQDRHDIVDVRWNAELQIFNILKDTCRRLPIPSHFQYRLEQLVWRFVAAYHDILFNPVLAVGLDRQLAAIAAIPGNLEQGYEELFPELLPRNQDVVGGVQEEREPGDDPGHDEDGARGENIGSGLRGGGAVCLKCNPSARALTRN